MNWYVKCWQQFANFQGRACRSEFWFFVIINYVIGAILAMLSSTLGYIFGLAALVPYLAVSARRMHDIDKPTWLAVFAIIPVLNLVLLVLALMPGTNGNNQFGAEPKN